MRFKILQLFDKLIKCSKYKQRSTDWHFHILFNQGKFTEQKLQNAILKATIRENLPFYCLELDKIDENMFRVTRKKTQRYIHLYVFSFSLSLKFIGYLRLFLFIATFRTYTFFI